jgi:hypothetical protein
MPVCVDNIRRNNALAASLPAWAAGGEASRLGCIVNIFGHALIHATRQNATPFIRDAHWNLSRND